MKLIRLAIYLATSLVLLSTASCKKCNCECPTQTPPAPNYRPSTPGSTWTYQPNQGQAITLTATTKDTVAAGKTYRVISSTNGPNSYWAKSGSEYYRYGSLGNLGVSGFEELYLKDNQPLNSTWKIIQPVSVPNLPITINAELTYTIKGKDLTRTVSGKAYKEVIHVRVDVSATNLGNLGGGDYYYANQVGLIESSVNLSLGGQGTNQTQLLTNYVIK